MRAAGECVESFSLCFAQLTHFVELERGVFDPHANLLFL